MCKVFLRDGFIDRYSGDKLLFPGLIKILTIEFPDIFKYHRNWKMSDTHMIYWELHEEGNLDNWDGLVSYFIDLTNKNPEYEVDKYVSDWKRELLKAIVSTKHST